MFGNESSPLISVMGTKVPGNEGSWTKVPGNESSNESSTYGTFVPGNESSLVQKFQLPQRWQLLTDEWCQTVAQCVHMDVGWIKVKVNVLST